jgi:hypothetical protein
MDSPDTTTLEEIESILQESEAEKPGSAKKIPDIESPKPVVKEKKAPRTQDPQPDKANDSISHLVDLAKRYPFHTYFVHCALNQDFVTKSARKCVFKYSLSRPRFYLMCRILDMLLWIIVIVLLALAAFKLIS